MPMNKLQQSFAKELPPQPDYNRKRHNNRHQIIMDYKKTNAPLNTVTRDMMELCKDTGNVYETVCIIAKRANQIAAEMKRDLDKKLQEFASLNDNLEEISENREQIEISRYYEKLPKPTLIAAQEYIEGKISYRNPSKDKMGLDD